jgi:hypothetical protein
LSRHAKISIRALAHAGRGQVIREIFSIGFGIIAHGSAPTKKIRERRIDQLLDDVIVCHQTAEHRPEQQGDNRQDQGVPVICPALGFD